MEVFVHQGPDTENIINETPPCTKIHLKRRHDSSMGMEMTADGGAVVVPKVVPEI